MEGLVASSDSQSSLQYARLEHGAICKLDKWWAKRSIPIEQRRSAALETHVFVHGRLRASVVTVSFKAMGVTGLVLLWPEIHAKCWQNGSSLAKSPSNSKHTFVSIRPGTLASSKCLGLSTPYRPASPADNNHRKIVLASVATMATNRHFWRHLICTRIISELYQNYIP